jgi:hypothetical protein
MYSHYNIKNANVEHNKKEKNKTVDEQFTHGLDRHIRRFMDCCIEQK